MKTKTNAVAAALLATGLMTAAGHAAAIEEMNFGLSAFGGSGPTLVNAKFLDLGFLGAPGVVAGFAAFKNTVELQITTTPGRDPVSGPAFTPDQLASFGLSAYPDLAVVHGGGNLGPGEYLDRLLLNFNPDKDISKLELTWGGAPGFGFPASGIAPVSFQKGDDSINAGLFGKYDMQIDFAVNALGPNGTFNSKLVFHYNGAPGSDENLDLSDFNFSATGSKFKALGLVRSALPGGIPIAAVPEPGTYAMLVVGLAALALVGRRQSRG